MKLYTFEEISNYMDITTEELKKIIETNDLPIYELNGKKYVSEDRLKDIAGLSSELLFSIDEPKAENVGKYDKRNKLNDLTGKQWMPETKSYWFQKGLGKNSPEAKIEKMHPAPFSFQDIERLILFFTKKNDTVLDPFLGVGSTLKAAALTNRKGIGIELVPKWYKLSIERLDTEVRPGTSKKFEIINDDSSNALRKMPSNSVDFIVTSPPYWNILHKKDQKVKTQRVANGLATEYSDDKRDLGNIKDYDEFLNVLVDNFILESARLLKPRKYLALVVSDFRNKSKFVPFHCDIINKIEELNKNNDFDLTLQGIKVLIQNHKSLHPYGYPFAYVENIHHQYILIFRKELAK